MSLTLTRRYNADRFGYLIPHRYGNLPMMGAVATYRPGEGRFGGAVAVEEATENLVTNPFFQEGKSGWETVFQSGLNFWDVTEGVSWQGGKSLVFEGNGNHAWRGIGQTIGPFAAGESITIQYVHRATGHLKYPLTVYLVGSSAQVDSTSLHTRSIGEWMLSSRTFTFLENTGQFQFELLTSSGNAPGTRIYLGGVQVEKKPYPTSFVDGSRDGGRLRYPADFFNQSSFTVAGWMKFHDPSDNLVGTSYRRIFEVGDSSSTGRHFAVRRRSATMVTFVIPTGNNDSQHYVYCTFRPREDGWIHFAFTRDGVNVRAIINGDVTEDTIDNIAEINPQKLSLGCRLTSGLQMNGLFDELLILPYAASEEEILSWYESQGPLPPHPQALLQWDWQAVRPAQIVKL